jgi:hypothetical protein
LENIDLALIFACFLETENTNLRLVLCRWVTNVKNLFFAYVTINFISDKKDSSGSVADTFKFMAAHSVNIETDILWYAVIVCDELFKIREGN